VWIAFKIVQSWGFVSHRLFARISHQSSVHHAGRTLHACSVCGGVSNQFPQAQGRGQSSQQDSRVWRDAALELAVHYVLILFRQHLLANALAINDRDEVKEAFQQMLRDEVDESMISSAMMGRARVDCCQE
jgi:hypothetical protein